MKLDFLIKNRKIIFGFIPVGLVCFLGVLGYHYSDNVQALMLVALSLWGVSFLFVGMAFLGIRYELKKEEIYNKYKDKTETATNRDVVIEMKKDAIDLENELLHLGDEDEKKQEVKIKKSA